MNQSSVFKNQSEIFILTDESLNNLKISALNSPIHRARINIHRSDDAKVHEMIIAITKECIFQPHRHIEKSESFHMIEGELLIMLFNDAGHLYDLIFLCATHSDINKTLSCKKGYYYRLDSSQWHSILPLSNYVIFHETTSGPFIQGQHKFLHFCPTEKKALKQFYWNALLEYPHASQLIKEYKNEILCI